MGYALGQFGSVILVASPPIFLHTPKLLAGEAERVGKRESLNAAQALFSNSQNTGMLINTVLVTNPKHSTIQAIKTKQKSVPDRPSTTIMSSPFMTKFYL